MDKKIVCGISLLVGAAAGFFGGFFFAKSKLEKENEEKISAMQAAFSDTLKEMSEKKDKKVIVAVNKEEKKENDMSINDYYELHKEDINNKKPYNRQEYKTTMKKYGTASLPSGSAPYVIRPDEYGEIEDYNLISLTLTSDNYLLDETKELLDDPISIVGYAVEHIGEYEDDAVHVRNDVTMCDYEILQDIRTLEEFTKGK